MLAQIQSLSWWGVVEIAVLALGIYQLVRVLRGTRAVPLALGVGLLAASYYAAGLLGFTVIESLLGALGPYVGVGLIILFQPEIRAALQELTTRWAPSGRRARKKRRYEDIVFAVSQLSQSHTGALIVIEREAGLKTFIQSGVSLDARLSSDLLVSIFQRGTPLHDGGVIIQGGRIAAAACFLPLTTNPELVSSLGTRHRAAMGVAEESDAVVLVVSETDGVISVAFGGSIERPVSINRLRELMNQHMGPVVAPPQEPAGDQLEGEAGALALEQSEDLALPRQSEPAES